MANTDGGTSAGSTRERLEDWRLDISSILHTAWELGAVANTDGGGTTVDARLPRTDGAVSTMTSTWSSSGDICREVRLLAAPRPGVGGAAEVQAEARADARDDFRV